MGVLDGLRVLDFGHHVAGPMLASLLADQGADVIKVEPPNGEPGRNTPGFEVWNRGKRSIVADLKEESDLAVVLELAQEADVAIENFRPGVADRLGIGARTLRSLNPRLVYCSLPGFGVESPYRDCAAWEGIVGARTAIYRPIPGVDHPVHVPMALCSTFAAIVAASGVAGALLARGRDGEGQIVEVPLQPATMAAFSMAFIQREPQAQTATGPRPLVRAYRCADGRFVQFHVGVERFAHDFFTLIDAPDLLDLALRQESTGDELAHELLARFEALFMTQPAQHWEDLCVEAKVPGTLCRTRDEWLDHPHTLQAQIIIPVTSPTYGETRQTGVAVRLSKTPGEVRSGAPELDPGARHGWLEPMRPDNATAHAPVDPDTQPLHGLRVLDLTVFLAGPTCARTLAELGAEVIKIDNPNRRMSPAFSADPDSMRFDVDRGKRSILIDLKTDQGREVFWQLLKDVDVVVENFRPGALRRLGLGYEDVAARHPDIVYASLSAYSQHGPWSTRPGFEVTTQAVTGTQVRHGRGTDSPASLPAAPNDYGTGMLAAFGVMLALLEKQRTGLGQHVDASLVQTSSAMHADWLLDYPGRTEPPVDGLYGPSARSRLYEASDGWFYLHLADQAELDRLLTLEPFRAVDVSADDETSQDLALGEALARVFASEPTARWLEMLGQAGLSAAANISVGDLSSQASFHEAGVLIERDHPGLGQVTHMGSVLRLDRTPTTPGRPVQPLGWSTDTILAESGFSASDVADLRKANAIA